MLLFNLNEKFNALNRSQLYKELSALPPCITGLAFIQFNCFFVITLALGSKIERMSLFSPRIFLLSTLYLTLDIHMYVCLFIAAVGYWFS